MRFHCALLLCLALLPLTASALPFNDDMVDVQIRPGKMMRAKSANSIPVGFLSERLENMAAAENLTNPLKENREALAEGARLFQINCTPCHGDIAASSWEPGVAGKLFALIQPPNIGAGDFKNRTDGYLYGVIYLGFGLMPRVGYKLSPDERWSIVSYLRSVQTGH